MALGPQQFRPLFTRAPSIPTARGGPFSVRYMKTSILRHEQGGTLHVPAGNRVLVDKSGMAAIISMSPRTMCKLMTNGCPHFKIGSRRVRFDPDEVLAWMRERFGVRRLGPAADAPGKTRKPKPPVGAAATRPPAQAHL